MHGVQGLFTLRITAIRGEVDAAMAAVKSRLSQAAGGGSGSRGAAERDPALAVRAERLKAKLKNAIGVMQEGLVERDAEVRLLLLAAMAGEHILLIGPPGTAKSEVGRRLNTLVDGTYFERLLTRFSVPEELFGPLSMRALENDEYIRQVDGYLPTAEVAFIDEIFKANSAILNTLLTVINERLFDNGNKRTPVPLISMVGASNELPESEELDALYDRFLVRRQVRQVSPAGVAQMLTYYSGSEAVGGAGISRRVDPALRLTREDIVGCKAAALSSVRVPQSVIQLVTDLRIHLQERFEPPVYVSDRRLVKSIQLLQVAAYCNGRDTVSEYDCLLLQHVLWQRPEQSDRIHDRIISHLSVDDGLKQVQYLLGGLFSRACRSLGNADKLADIKSEVNGLVQLLSDKYQQVAGNLTGGFPVVLDNLWLSSEESAAVATALEPKLVKTRAAVEQVLYDVLTLEVALQFGSDPVTLANLMPRQWADFIRNSDIGDVKPIASSSMHECHVAAQHCSFAKPDSSDELGQLRLYDYSFLNDLTVTWSPYNIVHMSTVSIPS
ncbi:hypothetical protein VOLCADRAFT_96404 [Volvox carteri f. nagariensis]|uniref:AAA+ ATPase domain-containing protein n=1 Tax=Volvox carteri f. nagariensis TaxID=3068 RepID=D8UA09_VOLCA|nr:uncharacterized protein VOLCADRAFT_96404 [Volvox carteri f. nagariensis]EFJ43346.1 hypothetical protein VOLCADRAFT_96404 [Volvox carteri f. nagariensis]|eukprot:XP_002955493.1 hypothetical protein VOLCADRAFT_96404 [Volvox carteri f. nagariensis]